MRSIPQKVSLVSQTRAILLEGIRSGAWRHQLPGQLRLCQELHISRWTLRSALDGLARDKFLEIRHGCACKITARARKTPALPQRARRIALLLPEPLSRLRQFVSLWVDDLRTLLADAGISLTIITQASAYRSQPDRVLKRLVRANPHDAWILMLSSHGVQAWFEEHDVPAIVTGASAEGITLPALDPNHHDAGVHAGHVLMRLGHRRIAYVRPRVATAGVLATESGLVAAVKGEPYGNPDLTILTGDTHQEIKRTMERALQPTAPTAFVFAKAFAAITALTMMTAQGKKVPGDLSMMCVEPEPVFEHLVPTLAYYTLSPTAYAKRMAQLITQRLNGTAVAKTHHLEMTYMPGESIGRTSGSAQ